MTPTCMRWIESATSARIGSTKANFRKDFREQLPMLSQNGRMRTGYFERRNSKSSSLNASVKRIYGCYSYIWVAQAAIAYSTKVDGKWNNLLTANSWIYPSAEYNKQQPCSNPKAKAAAQSRENLTPSAPSNMRISRIRDLGPFASDSNSYPATMILPLFQIPNACYSLLAL